MQKKRLDENTIQVIIDQADLDERGITMLDLLGDQQQVEDFFYSILAEVDTDHQFKKNDSVTFQALPIKNGLELIISKHADTQSDRSDNNQLSQMLSNQLKGHDTRSYRPDNNSDQQPGQTETISDTFVVRFQNFEDFIELSNVIHEDDLISDLYLYHHQYYLVIKNLANGDYSKDATLDYQAIANEYGEISSIAPSILEEHGKHIMSQSALDTARYYFK